MTQAGTEFAVELRELYVTAGSPPLKTVVRQAATQPRPILFADTTLDDWLNGKYVPADVAAVRYLVEYLQPPASRNGYQPRSLDWWIQLHRRAWDQTHTKRAGRPPKAAAPSPRIGSPRILGRLVEEMDESDALKLEVHESVSAGVAASSILPPYLERPHDVQLRVELAQTDRGSRLLMMVGGSSTGKTRACWEAIRAVLPGWRVWHPLTPERPDAVIAALSSGNVAPHTVIWLNEAQMYLQPAGVGPRVAAALQELLEQMDIGPFVVLGTMWPEYWNILTNSVSERHAAARELLRGTVSIAVPSSFSPGDLDRYRTTIDGDPRLQMAANQGGGRLTQHLAGAPELMRRYALASDVERAVMCAAIDGRRLGRWLHLPEEFLRRAAPGYLNTEVWEQTGDDDTWFHSALVTLTEPIHGAPGPLTRRKPLPDESVPATVGYRLADYLEQVGRRERAHIYPPPTFWSAAAATCTDGEVLQDLAEAARTRGRLRRAYQLHRQAGDLGHIDSLWTLAEWHIAAEEWPAVEPIWRELVERGDTKAMRKLGERYEAAGDPDRAAALYRKAVDAGDASAYWAPIRAGLLATMPERNNSHSWESSTMSVADKRPSSRQHASSLNSEIPDHCGPSPANGKRWVISRLPHVCYTRPRSLETQSPYRT